MELVEPVERTCDEEVSNLIAAIVEDESPPIGMLSLPRILVLIERCAIESSKRPFILRKVCRYPIQDHTDPKRMKVVDHELEIIRSPKARSRCEVRGDLISPRR